MAARLGAVERVIKDVRERLDEPLSLNDLARIAYISPFHFNRVFHQVTGLTPKRFLYALRLNAAKRLLLTTPLSVTDVCFEVGYNSLGTFTTRFTQLVGLSPCHLRRLADVVTPASLEMLCERYVDALGTAAGGPFITGHVSSPRPFEGLIFVGLFPLHIPQSLPRGGAVLNAPGPYSLGRVADGVYHLLAAALPKSNDALAYLLPDGEAMLVGTGAGPVTVKDGVADGTTDIALRPAGLTDPPLLISLPYLLTRAAADRSSLPPALGRAFAG
jgi:AraC-like DNA-binding protein